MASLGDVVGERELELDLLGELKLDLLCELELDLLGELELDLLGELELDLLGERELDLLLMLANILTAFFLSLPNPLPIDLLGNNLVFNQEKNTCPARRKNNKTD